MRPLVAGLAIAVTLAACSSSPPTHEQTCSVLRNHLDAASHDPHTPGPADNLPPDAANQLNRARDTYQHGLATHARAELDHDWAQWQPTYVAGALADQNC